MEASCIFVADIPGKGRGLVASRLIAGGETLLRDAPLVLVVDESAKAHCCSQCYKMSSTVPTKLETDHPHCQQEAECRDDSARTQTDTHKTSPEGQTSSTDDDNAVSFADLGESFQVHCKECHEVWFCGTECQRKARESSHSGLVCGILSKLGQSGFSSDEKNQARFLAAALRLKASSSSANTSNSQQAPNTASSSGSSTRRPLSNAFSQNPFEALLQLDGEPSIPDSPAEKLYAFLEEVAAERGVQLDGLDLETVARLLYKDQRNSYGIMAPNGPDGERRLRASGTYMRAALINHDCLPNVARFDYFDRDSDTSTEVTLRALHDIPAGTEICQSYFPVSWPYELRQDRLLEEYGFTCTCQRCQTEEAWSDEDEEDKEPIETAIEHHEPVGTRAATIGWESQEESTENVGEGRDTGKGKAKLAEYEESVRALDEAERIEGGRNDEAGVSGTDLELGVGDEDGLEQAVFFIKYVCPDEDCGGTMAPVEGRWAGGKPGESEYESADAMECNMCGKIRTGAEFAEELVQVGERMTEVFDNEFIDCIIESQIA